MLFATYILAFAALCFTVGPVRAVTVMCVALAFATLVVALVFLTNME